MRAERLVEVRSTLTTFIAQVDSLYLMVCLDVLLAAVEVIIDKVLASGKLRLADIAEMNPRFDIDQRTAQLAAASRCGGPSLAEGHATPRQMGNRCYDSEPGQRFGKQEKGFPWQNRDTV